MARATFALIQALRTTAARLESSAVIYRWSSYGQCNCGHLSQTVSGLTGGEIQERAYRHEGDWADRAAAHPALASGALEHPRPDYGDRPALDEGAWEPEDIGACAATGAAVNDLLDGLYDVGLSAQDVALLERLADPAVRERLGVGAGYFAHYERDNVVRYMRAWAELLEEQLDPGAIFIAAE